MNNSKFYICDHCKNIVEMINDSGVPLVCCGQKMTKLEAGVTEASREKHIPAVSVNDGVVNVCVGSINHPMTEDHYISWVYLVTDKGVQRKDLSPGSEPVATFALNGEVPKSVYAYCNLHGLWRADF